MSINKQKLVCGGLIISFLLYYIGIVSVVTLRSVGIWDGAITYEVTGVKAVLIGLFFVIISFVFLQAFINDLKKYIIGLNQFINMKLLYLLLFIFYFLTPVMFIQYIYIDLPMTIKRIFLATYVIYIIYMFIKLFVMYRYLNSKSETQ